MGKKNLSGNNGLQLPKFVKKLTSGPINQWATHKMKTTTFIIIKLLKAEIKKNVESSRRKTRHIT
jgi:hypothetical protein